MNNRMPEFAQRWVVYGVFPAFALIGAALPGMSGTQQVKVPPAHVEFQQKVRPLLQRYCFTCHGEKVRKSGLRLDTLDDDFAAGHKAALWREVVDRLNRGDMPPAGLPHPPSNETVALVDWASKNLRAAEQATHNAGGKVLLRRLNRVEYANTVRDLLDLPPSLVERAVQELPSDGVVEGFDNIGAGLMLDPSLLDRYLVSARLIAEEAIVTGPQPAPTRKFRDEFGKRGDEHEGNYIPDGIPNAEPGPLIKKGGPNARVILHGPGPDRFRQNESDEAESCNFPREAVPVEGDYLLRLCVGAFQGVLPEPVRVRFRQGFDGSNKPSTTFEVTAPENAPQIYTFTLHLKPGEPTSFPLGWNGLPITVDDPEFSTLASKIWRSVGKTGELAAKGAPKEQIEAAKSAATAAQQEGKNFRGHSPHIYKPGMDLARMPRLALAYAELEGPVFAAWPPKSHQQLLFKGSSVPSDPAYARQIFTRVLPRAYRRPVESHEIEGYVRLVDRTMQQGRSFEEGIRLALQAVLCSPQFLFKVEPAMTHAAITRSLNDYELASRLSYFLWSTMPDATLFSLAAAGKLHDPAIRDAQVDRMLKDPKSAQFVQNFAGQWLHVREFGTVQPSKNLYKNYDRPLEEAMKQEPLAFFTTVLREDRSVLNFLDSDFVVINDRLASHYGIVGVTGSQFRKVAVKPDNHRGGVLTQAGLLTLLSDGTRTLPVRRGAWILTNLFNDPPNPPPANVGQIQPNTTGKSLTVRQRLELHKKDDTCASCHKKIDAYGFGLENYDAVGAWRTRQNGEAFFDVNSAPPVDSSATLPDGHNFNGPEEFKQALLAQKSKFCSAFTAKLLMYALGRPVQTTDRQTVEEILQETKANGYRLPDLIRAVVKTRAFRTK